MSLTSVLVSRTALAIPGLLIRHLDSCDIIDNSDTSNSRQEQTILQDSATVLISNRYYLGFGGHGSVEYLCACLNPSFSWCLQAETVSKYSM